MENYELKYKKTSTGTWTTLSSALKSTEYIFTLTDTDSYDFKITEEIFIYVSLCIICFLVM